MEAVYELFLLWAIHDRLPFSHVFHGAVLPSPRRRVVPWQNGGSCVPFVLWCSHHDSDGTLH